MSSIALYPFSPFQLYNPFRFSDLFLTNPFRTISNKDRTQQDRVCNCDFVPSLSLSSTATEYSIDAEVAGLSKDDLGIEVQDQTLTIQGEKKAAPSSQTCHFDERSFGFFSRSIALPDDADCEHISAKHSDGVLHISIPRKVAQEKKHTISIA